jgi:putative aldouronate transport system substrate-binding protein
VNAEYAIATFPIVKFTEEQASKAGMYSTNLTSYVESMYAEWVVKGGVDAQWDEYIATLKKMGVDEMMKLTMEAYDYYMEQRAE